MRPDDDRQVPGAVAGSILSATKFIGGLRGVTDEPAAGRLEHGLARRLIGRQSIHGSSPLMICSEATPWTAAQSVCVISSTSLSSCGTSRRRWPRRTAPGGMHMRLRSGFPWSRASSRSGPSMSCAGHEHQAVVVRVLHGEIDVRLPDLAGSARRGLRSCRSSRTSPPGRRSPRVHSS